MNIIWHYLDKRGAAINALKDYGSMQYIIDHTDEEIDTVHDRMSSVGSPVLSDMPKGPHNSQANENRIIAAIDEIDVLKERYRQAVEYMDWFKPAWMALSEDERYRDLSDPARYSRIPADEDHFGTPLWAKVQLETDLPSYARAWTAVCMQEEKAAVSEEDPGGIHRGKYFEQGVFV